MVTEEISHLDLKQIKESGQCFRLDSISDNRYVLHMRDYYVEVTRRENLFQFDCSKEEYNTIWRVYLDVDTNYDYLDSLIDMEDGFLQEAKKFGKGMRILRQDLWEMCVSFIISQNNNIPRIMKSINSVCDKNGGLFPTINELSSLDLSGCGLGYRDVYLKSLCKVYPKITELSDLSKSLESFKLIKGVGDKVANCIVLYGLHNLRACPIDTWMKRIIVEDYKGVMPDWVSKPYAGYYQQLCFYYKRYGRR